MAEERGVIILKAPDLLLEKFLGCENTDISEALSSLSEHADVKTKSFGRENYEFYSSEINSGYLKLEYDCSEWSHIVEDIVSSGSDVELYARCTSEYGTLKCFSLTALEDRDWFLVDLESPESEDENKIKNWISSIPNAIKKAFPSIIEVNFDYSAGSSSDDKKGTSANLFCRFDTSISEKEITKILGNHFNYFTLKRFEDSELVGGGGYWDNNRIQAMGLKREHLETYTVVEWFPISEQKDIAAEELIEKLAEAGSVPTYALTFFGERSYPYRILLCENGEVKTIFNANEYSYKDLEILCDDKNDDLGMKINWFDLGFEQISLIHKKYGLKDYVDSRLKVVKVES
jgi:hypothetical protein